MGNIEFFGGSSSGPKSVEDSIFEVENASIVFKASWMSTPRDINRAARVSATAMEHLDHIVNEILRARDTSMAKGTYSGSILEVHLDEECGSIYTPASSAEHMEMINSGPGNGQLPDAGSPIKFVKLITKIKHRHHNSANFRIENDRHFFVVNVDKPNKTPDSILDIDVQQFCDHCKVVAQHL